MATISSVIGLCPCGNSKIYLACCGRYLEQGSYAPTLEALMRSRYTAHVRRDKNYLSKTERGLAANGSRGKEFSEITWIRLEVLSAHIDSSDPSKGDVEFKAHYIMRTKAGYLHEKSEFHKIEGQWYYVDGDHIA